MHYYDGRYNHCWCLHSWSLTSAATPVITMITVVILLITLNFAPYRPCHDRHNACDAPAIPLATFLKAPLRAAAPSLPAAVLEEAESCRANCLSLLILACCWYTPTSSSSDACACRWCVWVLFMHACIHWMHEYEYMHDHMYGSLLASMYDSRVGVSLYVWFLSCMHVSLYVWFIGCMYV